jgi:hypothetical protein
VNEPACSLAANSSSPSGNYDANDISLLKVKVIVQDVNDNAPKFLKKFYQIGVTSDTDYGDIILDSYVTFI